MLIDLILSILSFMQGPNLDENTVHMHKLVIPPSTISDWESFLRVHVQPGDYIFTSNIRSVVNKELRRALKHLHSLLPAIVQLEGDRCERSFATQYMQNMCRRELFETVLRVLETSHDPPLVRKWLVFYLFCCLLLNLTTTQQQTQDQHGALRRTGERVGSLHCPPRQVPPVLRGSQGEPLLRFYLPHRRGTPPRHDARRPPRHRQLHARPCSYC